MLASQEALDQCQEIIEIYLECNSTLVKAFQALYSPQRNRSPLLAAETIRVLLKYQFDRAVGAYCLIVNRLVWDAEIVLRSLYETAAKIIFLGASSESRREELATEYWTVLLPIYDKKGADRAEISARLSNLFGSGDARIFDALRNPDNFAIENLGNKKFRNEVENRWAFSSILKTLSSSSALPKRVVGLDGLAHMYGMMSHLAHASPKSIELMQDRATRGDDLVALESTHIYRMLNDSISLGCFSLRFAHEVEFGPSVNISVLHETFNLMAEAGKEIRENFDRSQDGLYGRVGF